MDSVDKMIATFYSYGVVFKKEEIQEVVDKAKKDFVYGMSVEEYQEIFLNIMGGFNNRKPFIEIETFIEKIGAKPKWNKIPIWVNDWLQIDYDKKTKLIRIDANKTMFYYNLISDLEKIDVSFFENELQEKMGEEYKVRKLFERERMKRELRDEIKNQFKELKEELLQNPKMVEMTEKVRDIAGEILMETNPIARKING